MEDKNMKEAAKKDQSKERYLVLEDLSYCKGGQIVTVKTGDKDVFLKPADVPQEALQELVDRNLVKVITL